MPQLVFHYFGMPFWRAEVSRLALHLGKVRKMLLAFQNGAAATFIVGWSSCQVGQVIVNVCDGNSPFKPVVSSVEHANSLYLDTGMPF